MTCQRIDPASRKWIKDHNGSIDQVTGEIRMDKRRLAAVDYQCGQRNGEVFLSIHTIDARGKYKIVTRL